MRALDADIALIREGWSAQSAICDRAFLMAAQACEGNMRRAEELATEISILQDEDAAQLMRASAFKGYATEHRPSWGEEWLRQPYLWGNILRHGWLVRRTFWAPRGVTADEAARHALSGLSYRHHDAVTAADVRPLHPGKRVIIGEAA